MADSADQVFSRYRAEMAAVPAVVAVVPQQYVVSRRYGLFRKSMIGTCGAIVHGVGFVNGPAISRKPIRQEGNGIARHACDPLYVVDTGSRQREDDYVTVGRVRASIPPGVYDYVVAFQQRWRH